MTLVEIGNLTKTDKNTHGFTEEYQKYFDPIKNNVKNVLEIGIFQGSSLRMWKAYFENANIIGLDVDEKCLIQEERIQSFLINQADRKSSEEFLKNKIFDIIIDDGGHYHIQQQCNWDLYFQHVAPGGYYIIEDLHARNHAEYWLPVNDPNCTYHVLNRFIETKQITTPFISDEGKKYLNDHIDWVNVFQSKNLYSETSIIKKKI